MPRRPFIAFVIAVAIVGCAPAPASTSSTTAGEPDTVVAFTTSDTGGDSNTGGDSHTGGDSDSAAGGTPDSTTGGDDTSNDADTGDTTAGEDTTGEDTTGDDTTGEDTTGGCTADCAGKKCGPDGCGGLCGFCVVGEQCSPAGQCGPECTPECGDKLCGSDGCGGTCGACPQDFACGADGLCYDVSCEPDCAGKVCGDDGCGGSCGDCGDGDICTEGQCAIGPCSGIPPEGKCDETVLYLCIEGEAKVTDCAAEPDMDCYWSPPTAQYACQEAVDCVPQCDGKQCGDDQCGGKCGACPTGWPCGAGTCEPAAGGGCGYYTAIGKCEEGLLWYCDAQKLYTQDCPGMALTCGFSAEAGKNVCK